MSGSAYGGVVINQNGPITRTTSLDSWTYETFTLPFDYVRGAVVPELSGIQVFVTVSTGQAATATLAWTLDVLEADWTTLASGTRIGFPYDGTIWANLSFAPVSVAGLITNQFRFGIHGLGGILEVSTL